MKTNIFLTARGHQRPGIDKTKIDDLNSTAGLLTAAANELFTAFCLQCLFT